jgi:hypothetical protein
MGSVSVLFRFRHGCTACAGWVERKRTNTQLLG